MKRKETHPEKKFKPRPELLYQHPATLYERFANLIILEMFVEDHEEYKKMSKATKHRFATAKWTIANAKKKFTELMLAEMILKTEAAFESFIPPRVQLTSAAVMGSPLGSWFQKASKLKPIGDTAITTLVTDKKHPHAVEPETEKAHNFLAWLGATEEAVEALCDGSKGETFKRVIAGLWATARVQDMEDQVQRARASYVKPPNGESKWELYEQTLLQGKELAAANLI